MESSSDHLNESEIMRYYDEALRWFAHYEPHDKQRQFHALGATSSERLFLAGNRTGKTYCGAVEMSMHLTGRYPEWWTGKRFDREIKAWAIGDTNDSVRETLQGYYVGGAGNQTGAIHPSLLVHKASAGKRSGALDHILVQHLNGRLSMLSFKSYEQGRKALQSAKLDAVHADEEPPIRVYEELMMRLMSIGDSQQTLMMVTATPLCGMTEVVLSYLEKDNGEQKAEGEVHNGRAYVQASWDDNPHLPEQEKQLYREKMRPHEREAREKGLPSLGSGMVYPIPESMILCDPFEFPSYWPKLYGMDFGWNPSPTAVLFGAYDRDNDILYINGEYTATERTPEQHSYQLLQRGCGDMIGVCDPAGGQSSQKDGTNIYDLYVRAGLKNLSKANNKKEGKDGEGGVLDVLQRMQNGQLKIFNTCKKTLAELRMYARDDLGRIKKGNDHLMDCLRYMVRSGIKATAHVQFTGSQAEPLTNPWTV